MTIYYTGAYDGAKDDRRSAGKDPASPNPLLLALEIYRGAV